jgi:hypothetical protein
VTCCDCGWNGSYFVSFWAADSCLASSSWVCTSDDRHTDHQRDLGSLHLSHLDIHLQMVADFSFHLYTPVMPSSHLDRRNLCRTMARHLSWPHPPGTSLALRIDPLLAVSQVDCD